MGTNCDRLRAPFPLQQFNQASYISALSPARLQYILTHVCSNQRTVLPEPGSPSAQSAPVVVISDPISNDAERERHHAYIRMYADRYRYRCSDLHSRELRLYERTHVFCRSQPPRP